MDSKEIFSAYSEEKISLIEYKKTIEALKSAQNELEKKNDILDSLCVNFVGIYRVNFDVDRCEIYRMSKLQEEVEAIVKFCDGYSAAMERYISMYVDEQDRDYVRAMTEKSYVQEQLKMKGSHFLRYHLKENTRGAVYVEIYYTRIENGEKEGSAILSFCDADAIVRREKKYKQETRRDIEEILEGSMTGIWTIELEDGCEPRMYADKTMMMLLGLEQAIVPEECYRHWFSRIETEYVGLVRETVQEILNNGRSEVTYVWNHPIQGKIYIRCGGLLDKKFRKPGVRFKGYHQDITETMVTQQRQEKAIMEALVVANQANQAKSEFLSHMSHDIRTPINGILGMLAICEKSQDDPEKQKECRRKIRISAEHLLSLINDVLDISKLESGSFSLKVESFDLNDLLSNCMTILRPQAEAQGISLEVKTRDLCHTGLQGSPLHLRQILINIIGNAIKYNLPNGKILVCVQEISAGQENAVYQFTVKDTGIGMSKEFLQNVFEPFTQENDDARTNFKGTGLGMAITEKLVKQMGGTIEAESEKGKGSVFTVTLPLQIDWQQKNRSEDREEEIRKEEVQADVAGMKILLVEDNSINCEIVQYMLEDAKANVIVAENGKEAVKAFSASEINSFDCILMDVMMPVMNGLQATRAIRTLKRSDARTVPIIALSANAFEEDIEKTREAGMNEHLTKPVDMDKLFQVIGQFKSNR